MKRCESCHKVLVPIDGMYVHPATPCSEEDGLDMQEIHPVLRDKFIEKYGVPEKSYEEELDSERLDKEDFHRKLLELDVMYEELLRRWFVKVGFFFDWLVLKCSGKN